MISPSSAAPNRDSLSLVEPKPDVTQGLKRTPVTGDVSGLRCAPDATAPTRPTCREKSDTILSASPNR